MKALGDDARSVASVLRAIPVVGPMLTTGCEEVTVGATGDPAAVQLLSQITGTNQQAQTVMQGCQISTLGYVAMGGAAFLVWRMLRKKA